MSHLPEHKEEASPVAEPVAAQAQEQAEAAVPAQEEQAAPKEGTDGTADTVTAVEAEAEADADAESEEEVQTESTGDKTVSFLYELTELFAISFAVVIVVLCLFVRHSPVSGNSMLPTIENGDTLLVNNIAYTPKQGDVVIVQSLHNLEKPLVKRVIAVGGDTISINFTRWLIEVNGVVYEQRLDADGNPAQIGGEYVLYKEGEPMLPPLSSDTSLLRIGFKYDPETDTYSATVPEGCLFILGDNRTDSKDSRDPTVGFVDERLVVGESSLRLTPFEKFGSLD